MLIVEDEVIVRRLMERNALRFPHREVVTFEDGERWSASEALAQGSAAADVFRRQGVGQGDVVAAFLPNGPDFLRAWWGTHFLGAVLAPFNLALKGNLLTHLIRLAEPNLCVAAGDLAMEMLRADPSLPILDPAALREGNRAFAPNCTHSISDTNLLIATSGTTGPSKLCRVPALQFAQYASYIQAAGLGEFDRFLLDLPMYHIHAMGIVRSAQLSGVPLSLRVKPSLSRYFEVVRETGATATSMVGTFAAMLGAAPERADDRDHSLRFILSAPLPENAKAFCERFGIEKMVTSFGSTELGGVIVSDPKEMPVEGCCGAGREHWDFGLVDENGVEVPVGEIGELVISPKHPALKSSYVADEAANEENWRDGRFHSGDLMRQDVHGNFFYVDRLKDSLRRRGENISSYEVENEVRAFPGVADVACVAAKSDDGAGDEVKVWIVSSEGVRIDFAELSRFMLARVPKYMVPRYYELIPALPMTPTNRVQKHALRVRGNGPGTWDLDASPEAGHAQA